MVGQIYPTILQLNKANAFDTEVPFLHQIISTDRSKAVLLLWTIYVFFCFVFVMPLCASVYVCLMVTCWERADLLALICSVYCEFVTFPLVSWSGVASIPDFCTITYIVYN